MEYDTKPLFERVVLITMMNLTPDSGRPRLTLQTDALPPSSLGKSSFFLTSPKTPFERRLELSRLTQIKRVLRHGTFHLDGTPIEPFKFFLANGSSIPAEAAGLEGFVFSERLLVQEHGIHASARLISDYFRYVKALLAPYGWTHPARKTVEEIEAKELSQEDKYLLFTDFVVPYTESLRNQVTELDHSRWSHWARIYHLFPRTFNLSGKREALGQDHSEQNEGIFSALNEQDLALLASQSFNVLRFMGTYPIGKVHAKGSAGGSPFSISRYSVDETLGEEHEVRSSLRKLRWSGLSAMFEFVPNHTAIDADLVEVNPKLYVHTLSRPQDLSGYYHFKNDIHGDVWIRHGGYRDEKGQRVYYNDTLQLDLSNPDTRELIILQALDLVERYGVRAFRIDMAQHLLNPEFMWSWKDEMSHPLPAREFLEELITSVKVAFPGIAFAAESSRLWDPLSEAGFDLIYGIRNMQRKGGHSHAGWYDSLMSRDPSQIRAAIRRAEFLHWQEGGADMLTFVGQHDMPSPWRQFGDWVYGAVFLTLMRPGPLCFYAGTEAKFEDPCHEDGKIVTFNRPASIDWSGVSTPFGKFVRETLSKYREIQQHLGEVTFQLLEPAKENGARRKETWVGFAITKTENPEHGPKAIVIANPSPEETAVTIEDASLGIPRIALTLPPCGEKGVELIYIPEASRPAGTIKTA